MVDRPVGPGLSYRPAQLSNWVFDALVRPGVLCFDKRVGAGENIADRGLHSLDRLATRKSRGGGFFSGKSNFERT